MAGQNNDSASAQDLGAPCHRCFRRNQDYNACHLCAERPFGSAPCLDGYEDPLDNIDCPECPNSQICVKIMYREWPLAEIAINLKKSGAI
jgi:hypothetical protein